MKPEPIDPLEQELTWIFVHVPWANPAARRKAIQRTITYLKQLRANAAGGIPDHQAKELGLACSACGRELPLATTHKRRFCGERCKKRYQRKRSQTPKIGIASG